MGAMLCVQRYETTYHQSYVNPVDKQKMLLVKELCTFRVFCNSTPQQLLVLMAIYGVCVLSVHLALPHKLRIGNILACGGCLVHLP